MENMDFNDQDRPASKRADVAVDRANPKTKPNNSGNIELLMDVSLRVTVELGRTRMQLSQILELQHGSVVELDRLAGDPVDVFVNDCLMARGEVVVVDDKFGVRITEMITAKSDKGSA
ncbi:MAG: flagellar motor switch protein FliN [Chloroflexi bacterium]|nr:flagellar motor switch protein FliN [Chloroflexota bacterium]